MIGKVVFCWFIAAILIAIAYGLWEATRPVHQLLGTQPGILEYAALAFFGFIIVLLIIAPFLKIPQKTQEI